MSSWVDAGQENAGRAGASGSSAVGLHGSWSVGVAGVVAGELDPGAPAVDSAGQWPEMGQYAGGGMDDPDGDLVDEECEQDIGPSAPWGHPDHGWNEPPLGPEGEPI